MEARGPVCAVVVGMGDRAMIYAREALKRPDRLQIVGVADVNPERVGRARAMFGIPEERCFSSAEALAAAPRMADAAINGTMDPEHVETTLPLLSRGYDVLLEKPFAMNQAEADRLNARVRETGRRVMVCHVLRYARFYRKLKETVASGELGSIINVQMAEQVSYFHQSVSYVRGKYASPERCGSGLLLSKCSHDLDLMAWLMAGARPKIVSSVGSVFQFRPEMAPEGAGNNCLRDCPVERGCAYSARRLYLEHPQRWAANVWRETGLEGATPAERERALSEPGNPYGRCVYRCNLGIVDHQSVMVGFENGATATFSVVGGASAPSRLIRLTGTRAEAWGRFEDGEFTVSRIAPEAPSGRRVCTVDVRPQRREDAHGGGDEALVEDFVSLVRGEPTSISCTTLEDSMVGHRLVYLAEDSRERGGQAMPYAPPGARRI